MSNQPKRIPHLRLLAAVLATAVPMASLALPAGAVDGSRANSFNGVRPDTNGGGEYVHEEPKAHLSQPQRQLIWDNIKRNARPAQQPGRVQAKSAGVLFAWPMRANGIADPGYHAISNFVDQDDAAGSVSDYSCGTRTYDGHAGTDFYLWPFSWYKMDNNQVQVIAAAPGTIVYRSDGNYDRSCSANGNNWNAVYVQHADGSIAWYGHMKNGSVTGKAIGASVAKGEYLGVVGSSGSSTEPHLHFEVYDAGGGLIDPYQGSCNAHNLDSWWSSQRGYYDSAINKLITGSTPPAFASCPNTESPNEKTAFRYGENAFFSAFYRDQLSSQPGQYRILRPNGTVYSSWTHSGPAAHYSSSWWYWGWSNFAPTGPAGTWRFEVTFNGQTYSKNFTVQQ